MGVRGGVWRHVLGAAVVVGLLPGCGKYLQHRGEDLLEFGDVGITITRTPYLSVHACGLGLVSAGAGRLDGQFIGLGGNQFGAIRHFHRNIGLIVWMIYLATIVINRVSDYVVLT